MCRPFQLLVLISTLTMEPVGDHEVLPSNLPLWLTSGPSFDSSRRSPIRLRLAKETTLHGSGLFLYCIPVSRSCFAFMDRCHEFSISIGAKEVWVKVKVKNQYLLHRFQIHLTIRKEKRSCGVVRSIMTDSRSVDPGSNPGTSTNFPDFRPQNSLKLIFVGVVRFRCA